jgi:choline-sulfatase
MIAARVPPPLALRTARSRRGVRAGALVVALAALAGAKPTAPPHILLVTVDTLRPDALGWVAGRNATPAIDALARESFRFEAARSPVPLTLPAHTSLLTALDPPRHGVHDNGQVLGKAPLTLAEALHDRGYATAAVVSGFPLRALFGLDRGFDRYDDRIPAEGDEWRERPALDTTEAALAWVRAQPRGRPWFLWVHYYDPHDPYTPPERLRRPGPRGDYDGEVALVDEALGRLRDGLAKAPAPHGLLTVFGADHGESLGEHGEATHGFFVYESTLQVPLLFHFPGRVRPGESALPARLVDVVPTLLELAGQPALPGTDGVSLVPLLSGRPQEIPPAYAETYEPWLAYGWAPLFTVRAGAWKLVDAPRRELYDLGHDPGETDNRLAATPDEAGRLLRILDARRRASAPEAARSQDPQAAEALHALGYVGGGSTASAPPPEGLADPKDRLRTKAHLLEADKALARRQYKTALAAFDVVLAEEPKSRFALLRSASALLALGRPRDAVPRLEALVAIDPYQPEARYQLADALTRSGRTARAIQEWRDVTRLQPRRAVAWSNLGTVLLLAGRTDEAIQALEEAKTLGTDDPVVAENLAEARYRRAVAELAAGRADSARRALAQAVAGDPTLRTRAQADPRLKELLAN